MLRQTVIGEIDRKGKVVKPETQKEPPDMNTILEISLVLTESNQGSSQSQSHALPCA